MSLERFHQAQASAWAGYSIALEEIRRGRKSSHWVWYIFPQIEGLGRSSTAREFALRDLEEACDYLRDPILCERYAEIAHAVSAQLSKGVFFEDLMGGSTDALKLASSLTLFREAASRLGESDNVFVPLAELLDSMLQQMAAQGYPACAFTLERVASGG
jgi:uncharacterized protein (DUF1810 family)